jgi:hypothetical protein
MSHRKVAGLSLVMKMTQFGTPEFPSAISHHAVQSDPPSERKDQRDEKKRAQHNHNQQMNRADGGWLANMKKPMPQHPLQKVSMSLRHLLPNRIRHDCHYPSINETNQPEHVAGIRNQISALSRILGTSLFMHLLVPK